MHTHEHKPTSYGRAFAIGVALNSGFVVMEAIFGLSSHSLALLSDAGHNLGDVLGLLLAWGASYLGHLQPTERRTYGMRRSSILAALANAVILLVVTGGIGWEAIRRLSHPQPVASTTILWVAAIGIAVNGITALMFLSGRKRDVNLKGAFLHMASDAAVALGVVLAALAMHATGWLWLDPVVSVLIGLVIMVGTWGLLRESLNLALDAVPENIHPADVEAYLKALPGVDAVHDLHIWGMSTTEAAMTAHLVTPDASIDDALLSRINQELHAQFGIEHTTVQFEHGDVAHPCGQAPAEVV